MAKKNQQGKNISKINGNSNYVLQGSKDSSESEIVGDKNTTIQGADSENIHKKADWWTKSGVIATIIGVVVAILTMLITCSNV